MTRASSCVRGAARGFSLIEVMVALIVIAVGLLGIAKMQSLALMATANASKRGLAAIEADSLAASMHVNRSYGASGLAPAQFTVTNGVISDPTLATVVDCTSTGAAPCTASQVAAYDVQQWGTQIQTILPNPTTSTVTCTKVVTAVPISCTIQIVWSETTVSVNQQGAAGIAGQTVAQQTNFGPTYTLYVEP